MLNQGLASGKKHKDKGMLDTDDCGPWPRPSPMGLPNPFYDAAGRMIVDMFALEKPETKPNRLYARDRDGRCVAISPVIVLAARYGCIF